MRRTAQVLRARRPALLEAVGVIHTSARKKYFWFKFCSELLVLNLHDTLGLWVAKRAP